MNAGGVPNTCKSNGVITPYEASAEYMLKLSGGRVSNAWVTCLLERNNTEKSVLIPYKLTVSHDTVRKDLSLVDGPAFD